MKRLLMAATFCALLASAGAAQQTPADAPATSEDIEKYFQVMHVRDNMKTTMDLVAKQARQMVHEQVAREGTKLPPEFEARTLKQVDDLLKDFPIEEMLQAMVPVYQKHLTKGDLDAIVAFYSTATGQKLLREQPAMAQEAMQAMSPLMQKMMKTTMERVQQEIADTLKDSKNKPGEDPKVTPN